MSTLSISMLLDEEQQQIFNYIDDNKIYGCTNEEQTKTQWISQTHKEKERKEKVKLEEDKRYPAAFGSRRDAVRDSW